MANKKFVLLGLVLPILVFFISYSAAFAYFTATTNQQTQSLSAIVKIGFQENQSAQKISHEVQTNGVTSASTYIMPGDTLITNSTIKNEGNVDVYSVFNFKITIEKKDGTTVTDVDEYYTFTTNGSISKLVADNGVYTQSACKMEPNQTVEISVSKYFKGSQYGNEYNNAKVTYTINALAIQTAGLGTPANAANMLINNQNGVNKNLQIFGGSVQNGTPTPETPVEIESVGDKTSNFADLSKAVTASTTTHVTFTYDNLTGTLEYTNTPYTFDYASIYLQKDIKYNFEIGKTYYCGADITVSGKQTNDRTVVMFGFSWTNKSASGMTFIATEDKTTRMRDNFTYDGTQENIRLVLNGNYGSVEPAKVKFSNVYFGEVDEFEPYGYKVPVNVRQNLFDVNNHTLYHYTIDTTEIWSNSNANTIIIPCEVGRTYIISVDYNVTLFRVATVDKIPTGRTIAYNIVRQTNNEPITITAEQPYLCVQLGQTTWNNSIQFLRVEKDFITNIYLNEPLRRIGDYADYIDFATGTVVRNVRSLELAIADMNSDEDTKPGWKDIEIIKTDFSGISEKNLGSLTIVLCNITTNTEAIIVNTSGSNNTIYLSSSVLERYQKEWLDEFPDLVVNICYGMPTTEVEVVDLPDLLSYSIESVKVNTNIQPSLVLHQK